MVQPRISYSAPSEQNEAFCNTIPLSSSGFLFDQDYYMRQISGLFAISRTFISDLNLILCLFLNVMPIMKFFGINERFWFSYVSELMYRISDRKKKYSGFNVQY